MSFKINVTITEKVVKYCIIPLLLILLVMLYIYSGFNIALMTLFFFGLGVMMGHADRKSNKI